MSNHSLEQKMQYLSADNRDFLLALYQGLNSK